VELNCISSTPILRFVVKFLFAQLFRASNNDTVCFNNEPKTWSTMVTKEFVSASITDIISSKRSG